MEEEKKKNTWGGRRKGAGRPPKKVKSRFYTVRVAGELAPFVDANENKSKFINDCIRMIVNSGPDFSKIGEVWPVTEIKDMKLPFFDISLKAGFPVPLDNDESSQNIGLLKMLCPNPEASYLIRVDGNSMIDADIYSGDIVIVDKSNRDPDESQVAVCELNGEYTLKRFVRKDGERWLVPANPDYPEIKVSEDDDFSIWGTVTYIIHKPRG